ncbi:hypothetical protein E3N88_26560 [Mikania micrantha]|uniref:CCHC-type domain-containing protein n=1 Tax=Mikania micrantha TaxID=192012 RepID=A0A5N6MU47_9ASTR|nr:hypothetical protein E3N88_26560 [Mikania micrantha]
MWWDGGWAGVSISHLYHVQCKQSDHFDYHSRYRAPRTFRPTGKPDPTPPARDPAVDALATLIIEELMVVLPGIITRIRNSEEFARNFPLLAAEKKEPEGGETSRKRKRCCSKKSRELVIYTEAIPLRQMAVAPESESRKCYTGKFPLCATCGLHHSEDKLCKHCLNCGGKGHWSSDCNNPPTHNQNPGNTTYPLPRHSKDCYVCGISEHISRDCPVRISSTSPAHSKGKSPLCSVCHYHHRAELSCVQCTHCGETGHRMQQCRSSITSTPCQYVGAYPKCVRCGFHHGEEKPCRHCLNCGRYGHWIQQCRFISTRKQERKASTSTSSQHNKNCYTCGMHGHFARDCPRKMPPADPAVTEELLALPAPGEHSESDDPICMQISA